MAVCEANKHPCGESMPELFHIFELNISSDGSFTDQFRGISPFPGQHKKLLRRIRFEHSRISPYMPTNNDVEGIVTFLIKFIQDCGLEGVDRLRF
jgi:hypothetical protein